MALKLFNRPTRLYVREIYGLIICYGDLWLGYMLWRFMAWLYVREIYGFKIVYSSGY